MSGGLRLRPYGRGRRAARGGHGAAVLGGARPMAPSIYAALDHGTNNCRLLIARPQGAGFRVTDACSRIVRHGEGIAATACISEVAIGRAIAALASCRSKTDPRNANRLRLDAPEACRQAANGDLFRSRVASEAGIQLEVIKRE